jgi:hypothetical protein
VEWSNGRVQGPNPRRLREFATVIYGMMFLQDEANSISLEKSEITAKFRNTKTIVNCSLTWVY